MVHRRLALAPALAVVLGATSARAEDAPPPDALTTSAPKPLRPFVARW